MGTALIIALIILGLILILLELFVTPGFVTGALGGVAWYYALYKIYHEFGTVSGHCALAGLLLLLIACIVIAVKSGVWEKVSLKSSVEGKVNEMPDVKLGDSGYTSSALRPMGRMVLNNISLEVTSFGELVEAGAFVEVVKIENNKIYVKQISL
ncbi:MAG: NfeD family protein [Bacteroidia bacterium]|nr:NfeD family protein [Bacteroidia bacterium]